MVKSELCAMISKENGYGPLKRERIKTSNTPAKMYALCLVECGGVNSYIKQQTKLKYNGKCLLLAGRNALNIAENPPSLFNPKIVLLWHDNVIKSSNDWGKYHGTKYDDFFFSYVFSSPFYMWVFAVYRSL